MLIRTTNMKSITTFLSYLVKQRVSVVTETVNSVNDIREVKRTGYLLTCITNTTNDNMTAIFKEFGN